MLGFSSKYFLTSARVLSSVKIICSIELDLLGFLSDDWGGFFFFCLFLGRSVPLVHAV